MTIQLPESLTYGKVVGRFLRAVGDTSADVDNIPDGVAATGSVTFTPALVVSKEPANDPQTAVIRDQIPAVLDSQGYLTDPAGNRGIWLVAGVYKVTYNIVGVTIPGHNIEVLASHTELAPLRLIANMTSSGAVLTVSQYSELSGRIDTLNTVSVDIDGTPIIGTDRLVTEPSLQDPSSSAGSYLNSTFASFGRAGASEPAPLHAVTTAAEGSNPRPVDVIGSTLYGASGTTLYRSTDDGVTWTSTATTPYNTIRLLSCADGEVLAVSDGYIHKSSGWATNPATATWTLKRDAYQTASFYRFSVDGDGTRFIASEYATSPRSDSRYVHISTDAGATWATVWDTVAEYPATHGDSHVHGCCYDPWEDRFWFTEGHGEPRGFYYSDDDGATWTKLTGAYTTLAATPTALVATDDGIVMGTDDSPNGILGIRRAPAAELEVSLAWQWFQKGKDGAYGFAERGFRDPATGLVYFCYRSEYAQTDTIISAGTATSGGQVWNLGTLGTNKVGNVVVTPSGRLAAWYDVGGAITHLYANVGRAGSVPSRRNSGNIEGGTVTEGSAVAIGKDATTSGGARLAAGAGATATGLNATAVGPSAAATGSQSTALGQGVTAASTNGTGVGWHANPGVNGNSTAVGASAASTAADSTAVGVSATASGSRAVAIGKSSTASGIESLAVGGNASAAHDRSVALGWAVTSAASQWQVGNRHLELAEMTPPANGATNTARLYVKDNGAGKSQLVVKFATGAEIVLATEA